MKKGFRVRLCSAIPIISLIIFLLIGFIGDEFGKSLWHPAWIVFFLIPITPILLGLKKLYISYPIFCVIAYITLGIIFPEWGWHPGWIIFLTIPVVSILFPKKRRTVIIDDGIED